MMFATEEQRILDRLRAALPPDDLRVIEPERDATSVGDVRGRCKTWAVWLIYNGFSVGDAPGGAPNGARVQQIEQQWIVVVGARSARGNGTTTAARDKASEISMAVIEALIGFDVGAPNARGKYLRLQESSGPEYDAGYCEVPLAFANGVTVRGKA